jgi:hypothetical protein
MKKNLSPRDAKQLSTIQQIGRISTDERVSFVRVHAIKYISTVEKMGKVPWDKKWVAKETNHYFLHYPFLNIGKIGFEWVFGKEKTDKKKSVLIIHMPSIKWNPAHGNPELYLRNVADMAGTWFMKKYHCDLRGLKKCGKGHFEMPVHDEKLVSLAQATSIRVGDFILDSSLGYPEFGSVEGYDVLAELLSLPKRVAVLEKQMVVLTDAVSKVVSSVEKIGDAMKKLTKTVDKLDKLLSVPKKPDEKLDVT